MLTQDQLQEIEVVFESAKAVCGRMWGSYFTAENEEQNVSTLLEWMKSNLPGGLNAAKEIGSWEIAFRECRDSLVADPNYVAPLDEAGRRKVFNELYDGLTFEQTKSLYEGRMPARPLSAEQQSLLEKIGGQKAFARFAEEK